MTKNNMFRSKDDVYQEARIKGWIEEGEQITNIPEKCPKCGNKLRKVTSKECGIIFIYCSNSKCRWCEIYES